MVPAPIRTEWLPGADKSTWSSSKSSAGRLQIHVPESRRVCRSGAHKSFCVCVCVLVGKLCREFSPDVMQQESPASSSFFKNAGENVRVCMCVLTVYAYRLPREMVFLFSSWQRFVDMTCCVSGIPSAAAGRGNVEVHGVPGDICVHMNTEVGLMAFCASLLKPKQPLRRDNHGSSTSTRERSVLS